MWNVDSLLFNLILVCETIIDNINSRKELKQILDYIKRCESFKVLQDIVF